MIKQLLEEVAAAPLDDASRQPAAGDPPAVDRRARRTACAGAARRAGAASRCRSPRTTPPSEGELRIAQAQLVGWLEGLFHGIQAALVAQQMAARVQLEQMRGGRPALPGGHRRGVIPGHARATGQPERRPRAQHRPVPLDRRVDAEDRFQVRRDPVVLVVRASPRRRPPARPGARWPPPPPRPAQASIGTSLGMSPNASTSAAATPSRSQYQASPAALVTPAAEISTRPDDDECVASATPASAVPTSAANSSGSRLAGPDQQLHRRHRDQLGPAVCDGLDAAVRRVPPQRVVRLVPHLPAVHDLHGER